MQLLRLVDVGALVLNGEVLGQRLEELLAAETVEVFHHAVVVKDSELRGLEADRHEVVVFLIACVVGIEALLLGSHECGCC